MCTNKKTVGRFTNNESQTPGLAGKILFNDNMTTTRTIAYNSGDIIIKQPGIYSIRANFTAEAGASNENANVYLTQNGNSVPGASSSITIVGADDLGSLSINSVAVVYPSIANEYARLSFVNSVATTSYNVANVIIERIA